MAIIGDKVKDTHQLKSLEVRRTTLNSEISVLETERKRCDSEINRKKQELDAITKQINSFAVKEPVVSEHAMLRYIERVMNIDLDDIKNRILTEQNRNVIEFAGSCRIKSEGVELVVKNKCVVSVVV
jgi:chromosome segregation ATPase